MGSFVFESDVVILIAGAGGLLATLLAIVQDTRDRLGSAATA
jgi:hypothetical protein